MAQDYVYSRVIIGVKPDVSNVKIASALAAYHATVIADLPVIGQKVLAVPKGTVSEAVVGLARYPFITFAAHDVLAHTDPKI